ncbi:MAG: DUF305 domain-containing protein [Lachnospiraceae bacterium]|nr:DUF305 domain-containing protein [Lachnospiraceae bacterium]MDE7307103.1 DUF305 domain-containing protein [Lachnospiraceae bacterium]
MQINFHLNNAAKDYFTRFYCILDEMIQGMTEVELTGSISHNFIVQMIPHHRAAVEMSKNILNYTSFPPLKKIASQIVSEQTQGIEDMKNILCECETQINSDQDLFLYQRRIDQIMQTMFSSMGTSSYTNHLNISFIKEMIPHHEGAVKMSENALMFCTCPELIPILQSIITSQKRGIMQMQQLLKCSRQLMIS